MNVKNNIYTCYCNQYKKLIRRWDSERELSLRWHRTHIDTMVRVWVAGKNCVIPLLHTSRDWLLVAVLRDSLLCGWAVWLDYNKGSFIFLFFNTKYNRLVHKFRQRSTRLCVRTQVCQIQWNNAMQRPLRRSRSFKVTDFGTNRKLIRLPISD